MRDFSYSRAGTAAEALHLISNLDNARFLGGGTNLVDLMRENIEQPDRLVDVTRLNFSEITETPDGGLSIGAGVKNTALANHLLVRQRYPVLSQAILFGASGQIRNMATVGGNLMQRTRCCYFYDHSARCNKRSPGSGCDAIDGFNRMHAILGASEHCIATNPSDMCVALAALGATVRVEGAHGERTIPFDEFHFLPGSTPDKETALGHNELITAVDLPALPFAARSSYRKIRDRSSYAFALVSVAAALAIEDGRIRGVRLALGGVAPKPWRAFEAERVLMGAEAGAETFRRAAEAELAGAKGYRDNAFKIELAKRVIAGVLSELSDRGACAMSVMQKVVEKVAQYQPDKKRDPLLDRDGFLGKPFHRVDAEVKVTGRARFTAEFDLPGMAHAVLVYSSIAKGKVTRIDTEQAKRAPGVLEILTYKNMPHLQAPPLMDVSDLKKGLAASDLPILQDAAVHWDGQPVAVVVAERLEQAEYAASLVAIEYRTGKPALSFEGMKPQAFVPSDVMGEPAILKIGNVEQGIQDADARIDHVYRTPRYNHNAIEPHATTALWNEDGTLAVLESSQSVNTAGRTLALIFGLDPRDVQVVAPFVGGGFGGKGGLWNHTSLCAAAAKVVKRPVKLALSREGVFRAIGGRTIAEQRVALAAKKDGQLTTLLHSCVTATTTHGRYAEQCTFPARHLYASPNIYIEQKIVNLDTVANTWMRAPGESIGTFALESAMDELAYALRMDPIELRRINEPEKDPTRDTKFSSRLLPEAYRRGAEKFGWNSRNPLPRTGRDGKWLVGQGVATAYYPFYRFPAKVRMRISVDGRAIVQTPAAEMGMGTATVQIQHAADRLGLPLQRVAFHYGDSNLPDTPVMAGGSNQTATIFAAVQAAAEEIHRELLKLARTNPGSPLASAKYEDLEARDGGLYRRDDAGAGETYVDILRRTQRDWLEVETQSAAPMESMKYSMASYGAQFCEVRVHEETGEVRVSRWLCAMDCGKVVNPKTATSQLRGGIIMGIGMALTEETLFDERRGRIMNPSMAEYHIPVNLDVPEIDILFLNIPDEQAPYGARGIGEIGITGAAAAIANAVHHATGRRVRDLPITLDKLL